MTSFRKSENIIAL